MTRSEFSKMFTALQALNLPPATPAAVEDGVAGLDRIDPEYFKKFVARQKDSRGKPICVCCRKEAAIRWTIVHGEAACLSCGWPSRVYHYDLKDAAGVIVIKRLNYTLEVHPSETTLAEPEESES